eukprot:TRINITY_DN11125_c0_g1_i2.p2 TRINITY_DN11125_c0_g1~~TRINITY_DN11125_c0_g1_i2.p2  ORF type:complete len:276 (-),score=58.59 TRINITY_DN11125_c0_g1_i2:1178-2005(-)
MQLSSQHRIFCKDIGIDHKKLVISGPEQRHIKAKRLKKGDTVEVFDGNGLFRIGTIQSITKSHTHLAFSEPKEADKMDTKSPTYKVSITLAVAMPKGDRGDYLLEKCTEIGVTKVIPLISKRSVFIANKRNKEDATRISRWNRLIIQASKQSLCPVVPQLKDNMTFDEVLSKELPIHNLVLWGCMPSHHLMNPLQFHHFSSRPPQNVPQSVLGLIGPEGDFTPQEMDKLKEAGAIPVILSPNILRTETAATIMVSNIMTWFNRPPPGSPVKNPEE